VNGVIRLLIAQYYMQLGTSGLTKEDVITDAIFSRTFAWRKTVEKPGLHSLPQENGLPT
jgi:hypothetical protein